MEWFRKVAGDPWFRRFTSTVRPQGRGPEPPLKDTTGIGYGWVGNEQRATQTTGLLLMGARLYNPATGTFTSMDPVFGGNTTTYAYPQDPINAYDLDGQWGVPGWAKSAGSGRGNTGARSR